MNRFWWCFLLAGTMAARASGQVEPRIIPERSVPVPDFVSAELQRIIASPVVPDFEPPASAEAWKKLQKEGDDQGAIMAEAVARMMGATIESVSIAGVPCYRVVPAEIDADRRDDLLFHVHGGAFVFLGGKACVSEAILLAKHCKMPVLSVDYRRPPDHPFPAPLDDVVNVWKALIAEHQPGQMVMGGTSAGGTLTMAAILRMKEEGLAKPAAIFLGTPGADLGKTGDSCFINEEVDYVLGRYEGLIESCVQLYANGRDLKDPMISPVYGDLSRFPPTILVTGTRDLLLSATVRTHRKLRAAHVPADLHVFEGMSHADYLLAYPSPESIDALDEIAAFFDRHLE